MNINLTDGRKCLFQWDTGCFVEADEAVSLFHFANRSGVRAYTVESTKSDGLWIANIPDELLQEALPLRVFAMVEDEEGQRVFFEQKFQVTPRPRPADYVYTPTDQASLEDLQEQIGLLIELETEDTSCLVAAINELAREVATADEMVQLLDETKVARPVVSRDGAIYIDEQEHIFIL